MSAELLVFLEIIDSNVNLLIKKLKISWLSSSAMFQNDRIVKFLDISVAFTDFCRKRSFARQQKTLDDAYIRILMSTWWIRFSSFLTKYYLIFLVWNRMVVEVHFVWQGFEIWHVCECVLKQSKTQLSEQAASKVQYYIEKAELMLTLVESTAAEFSFVQLQIQVISSANWFQRKLRNLAA